MFLFVEKYFHFTFRQQYAPAFNGSRYDGYIKNPVYNGDIGFYDLANFRLCKNFQVFNGGYIADDNRAII